MPRPIKEGLDYFPLVVDFFSNKKIKNLRRAHGPIGALTYLNLLCRVYRGGYFYRFESLEELAMDIAEEIASEQIRRTATSVAETINYLVGRGILDEGLFKKGIISGVALQEQYVISAYKAKRKIKMDVHCLVDVSEVIEKNGVYSEETEDNSEETEDNSELSTQSKMNDKETNYNSFIQSAARDEDVFSPEYRRRHLGGIGKNVVFLSDEQMSDLLDKMSIEEFDYYVGVVADSELKGHHYKKKTHYQAILDMAFKDRKVGK
jgi:hypothetical protein